MSGVTTRQLQALFSETIQMGCLDDFVPVAGKVSISEIIAKDDHKVRPLFECFPRRCLLRCKLTGKSFQLSRQNKRGNDADRTESPKC